MFNGITHCNVTRHMYIYASYLLAKDDDPLTMDSHPCLAKMIHIKLINFSAPFSMLCFTNLREN